MCSNGQKNRVAEPLDGMSQMVATNLTCGGQTSPAGAGQRPIQSTFLGLLDVLATLFLGSERIIPSLLGHLFDSKPPEIINLNKINLNSKGESSVCLGSDFGTFDAELKPACFLPLLRREYPDFYKKLYGLLDASVFHVKYRSRFFHLLDLFLSSS